ncbi:MAG TPA: type II CAAX endopeptidase family protein [Candidatus Acidoferrales bacterium]|nr:type II CAAX endopeptidase family protein [Candidatus Acidoferrales bacterium]
MQDFCAILLFASESFHAEAIRLLTSAKRDFRPVGEPNNPLTTIPPRIPREVPGKSFLQDAFFGPAELRAGWRLLIFFAVLAILFLIGILLTRMIANGRVTRPSFNPLDLLSGEALSFLVVLLASWIMAKMEGRTIADYGLPRRGAFGGRFWQGIVIGFASITALLVSLRVAGVFHFGMIGLHGAAIWEYAALWGAVLLCVGFFEEFAVRGYALFTLTTGIGFWPAAIVMSVFFGYLHHSNSGESIVGTFNAGAVGFLFCLLLRRTGDLWMPIGFHAAWDWGETYFYGVPDSGQVAQGHLFNAAFSGPTWLTGGTVGPEGSWFCFFLLVLLWFLFATWLREVKYPNPQAILGPRSRSDVTLADLPPSNIGP